MMKNFLPTKLVRRLFAIFFLLISFFAFSQSADFNSTYVFFNVEGSQKSYKLKNNPTDFVTPNFEGNNLGTFNSVSIFQLKGAEHNVVKCNNCNISATNFNYRIYKTGDVPGSFIPKSIAYSSGGVNGCEDQQWKDITGTDNLLSGLSAGNYSVEVYSDAIISCGTGTMYASNEGLNFKATFTYATDFIWNGSADATWTNPTNWTPNAIPGATDNVTVTGTPVLRKLEIDSDRSVNNFILAGSDPTSFSLASGKTLTINGNLGYSGTASAVLDCGSTLLITNTASQLIPPLTYGNLNILGGPRVLSPTGIIKICSNFNVDSSMFTYTSTGSTVEYISSLTGQKLLPFTYNNLTFSGSGNFSFGSSSPTVDKTINVKGNYVQSAGTVVLGDTAANTATLNIDGDMTINNGTFDMNKASGGKGTLNLKGDLTLSSTALLNATTNTIANTNFNFTGTGDGLSPATTQTIDVANQATASNITFNVNSASYARLINQNFALGTNTAFNVKTDGILDFGFNGSTALNISKAGNGQTFTSEAGSSLKISSPDGITKTADLGNVQIPVDSRIFSPAAIYHYVGNSNQVTGNGLPKNITGRVIIELDIKNTAQDDLEFRSTGTTTFGTIDGKNGLLEIRKGKIFDVPDNGFRNSTLNVDENNDGENDPQKGNLNITGGRYVIAGAGIKPSLSGSYILTGGVIEFKGEAATKVRTGAPARQYFNVDISGNKVELGGKNFNVNNLLKIFPTGVLNVPGVDDPVNPYVVTARKGIEVQTGGMMMFNNNAQLLQDADAVNNGNITMVRKSKMKRLDYIYWGAPVSGQPFLAFSPNTIPTRFYNYNEVDDSFSSVQNPATSTFMAGKGYAIRAPNIASPANYDLFEGKFSGVPNNGNGYTFDLKYSNANHGLNMISNPYPSNIDLRILAGNNPTLTDGLYYFWTNNANSGTGSPVTTPNGSYGIYNVNQYATLNALGSSPASSGATGSGIFPSYIIRPGQGFLIKAKAAGTLTFNHFLRTSSITDGTHTSIFFNNRQNNNDKVLLIDRIWLRLITPANNKNILLLGYIEEGSNTFDSKYDAEAMNASDQFYSVVEGKHLAIQGRSYPLLQEDIVPLGASFYEPGTYSIGIERKEGIFESGQPVFLHDKKLNNLINLQNEDYSFITENGVDEERFELVYKENHLNTNDQSNEEIIIYRSGVNFVVKARTKIEKLEVYDSVGRKAMMLNPNQSEVPIDAANLPTGIYFLTIKTKDKIWYKKVLK